MEHTDNKISLNRIKLLKGDITEVVADAIVNAANNTLLGGGGVDGAIHRTAGLGLLEECMKLKGCATGEAKITKGYNLPAKYVIHTVGPVWRGGNDLEEEYLTLCYRNALDLAEQYDIQSIAFPSISTGAYGFPIEKATLIALEEAVSFLKKNHTVKEILFVLFTDNDFRVYEKHLKALVYDTN